MAVDAKKNREREREKEREREREKIGEQTKTEEVGASTDAKRRGLCPTMQTIEGKEEKKENARRKHVRTLDECHSIPKKHQILNTLSCRVEQYRITQTLRRLDAHIRLKHRKRSVVGERERTTKYDEKDNQKEIRSKELIYIYLFITYAHANAREIIFVRRKSILSLSFSNQSKKKKFVVFSFPFLFFSSL